MMHRIKWLWTFAVIPVVASANTRYSGEFDYRLFKPSAAYFAEHSQANVAQLCKTGERASTEDLEQCGHRKFEGVSAKLDRTVATFTAKVRKNDVELQKEGEPIALPYFQKAQAAWAQYRDNTCYNGAYEMGPGSEKYILFWDCMASMTKDRIKELTHPGN